jgi:hypothetical protein
MASVQHGSARTTPRIRAEPPSVERERPLPGSALRSVNPKTVWKWRQRTTTADAPMGPKVQQAVLALLSAYGAHFFRVVASTGSPVAL